MSEQIYDFPVRTIEGKDTTLGDHRGEVMLIVNTASECGFTPQYDGLEKLHEKYQERGLAVLGFPCNQFGGQEPGARDEIQSFCKLRFGVTFPLFEKIDVNGKDAHPLYEHLKSEAPGLLGSRNVKWNFTKFLVDRDGRVIERFSPTTKPEAIESKIEEALDEKA
jgi:glutathione peroxidase